jgi:hypothetical protein
MVLSGLFLEHVISVLSQIPVLKCDVDRVDDSQVHNHTEDGKLEAAIFALTAFFRSVLSYNSSLKHMNHPTIFKLLFDAEVGEKLEKGLLSKIMLLFFLS